MATARQVEEAISRCVSAMAHYHEGERSPRDHNRMVAEVWLVAGFAKELGFSYTRAAWRIVSPVEDELFARYGLETGKDLAIRFIEAFRTPGEIEDRPRPGDGDRPA